MAINKFEKQALKEINRNEQITEGLSLSLLKWFFKPKVKKAMKKLASDGDLQSTIITFNQNAKKLKDDIKNHPRRDNLDPELVALINKL